MSYAIVADSCCDLPKEIEDSKNITLVPLTLRVEDKEIVDDETFDQKAFIDAVAKSKEAAKSACPSPQAYIDAFNNAEDVYVVTLSAMLSGSYNSAVVAADMYKEENPGANVHIFNSRSAACGEGLIALKICEYAKLGMKFDEVVNKVENFISELDTYFVIETLEPLRKNGRLDTLTAFVAETLNIKPVMGSTKEGSICKISQARGIKKATDNMIKVILERTKNSQEKVLAITHCNCRERAEYIKEKLLTKGQFKNITIANAGGVSTLYACDGGIVVTV